MKAFRPKSQFTKNVLTLMAGTTIAQAIPVAISPILTRLYTPEDFGIFALYMAITTILGSIASGRYELAIMLPEEDGDAINIAALGFLIAIALSIISLVIVISLNSTISKILNNTSISNWLYLMPLSILLTGLYNVLNYFNIRKKHYKDIAIATVYKSIVLASAQIVVSFVKSGVAGLIVGRVLSMACANRSLLRNARAGISEKRSIRPDRIFLMAKRYQDFPKFSLPAVLASSLAANLLSICISSIYSVSTLGYFSLVQRVLVTPTSLIGSSIGQVFFQQAVAERKRLGTASNAFDTTVKKLLIIAVPIFLVIYISSEAVFALVFGEEWRIAGTYATLMVPLFFTRFIVATVSTINSVFEKQKISLFWQLGLLMLSLGLLYSSFKFEIPFQTFLLIYSWSISGYYVFLLGLLYLVSRSRI